jgi:N-acetylglucosamine kinase-like BadF-type ATPase
LIAVGVDAGASATVAAVSHDGVFAGTVRGGPANPTAIGLDDAADTMLRTIRRALDGKSPDAIYIGAAGCGRADVASTMRFLIASGFPRASVEVGDDASIALRGAIPTGPGIVLIAGTGSIALADNGTALHRVGGLGYLIGDEGSALSIGLAAVRELGRVYDGRRSADETTSLVERTLAIEGRDGLLDVMYDRKLDVAKIAALAPAVVAFAGKGNRLAGAIVGRAGADLAGLVIAAARVSGLIDQAPPIALAGGLMREASFLTALVESQITIEIAGAQLLRSSREAYLGALQIAEALARDRER